MTTPSAKNGLKPYAMHFQRRKYVREVYPRIRKESAIDLWYGPQAGYGKVDPQGRPVIVKRRNLTNFPSKPDVFALNFVVDAFEDLRQLIVDGIRNRTFGGPDTFLTRFIPQRGYEDPLPQQEEILDAFSTRLIQGYIPNNNRDREIKSVEDYIPFMIEYFSLVSTSVSLTSSSMINSALISPLVSGLMVEISSIAHSDDKVKVEQFVSDINFDLYQQAVRKFGFRIDYNAPWRLVADVNSEEMKEYMGRYNIRTYTQLFNEYYERPMLSDILNLKDFVFNSYNDFVEFNPYTKIPSVTKDGQRTKFCLVERFEIDAEDFNQKFDEVYWLNFFFHIRAMELGVSFTKQQMAHHHRRIAKITKDVDFNRAMGYIEAQLRKQRRRR